MIECKNLSKSFADDGIFDLSFSVKPGQAMGILGPSGAGKSLLMRLLLGQLKADQGSAQIFSQDCWSMRKPIMKRLAFCPAHPLLESKLTGEQYLVFVGRYHGTINPQKARDLCEQLDISLTGRLETMDTEARKKLALLAALSRDADVYLLDAPFLGLSQMAKTALQDVLRRMGAKGACILLTSHVLEDVRRSCTDVIILRKGRQVVAQQVQALSLTRQKVYHITFETADQASDFATEWESAVELIGLRALVAIPASPQALIKTLANYTVVDLVGGREEGEESFLRFYGDDIV